MVMKKIMGTVNGLVKSTAWIGNVRFEFDGTTLGLVKSAVANGAIANTKIKANFGGRLLSNARDVVIIAAPHDPRANGFWAR